MSALDSGIWEEGFRVRSFDVDFSRRASLDAMCRYFLDAAWAHAEHLGVGFKDLQASNRLWVLSRLLVRIHRLPDWGEPIRVHTWPRTARSVFALRDFEILDHNGTSLLAGSSAWLVLDASKRRPQRIERVVAEVQPVPRSALGEDPEKVPEPRAPILRLNTPVRYLDIDVNGHVTSARYIGWLLDSYPIEFHGAHILRRCEINYTGETRGNDMISVHSELQDSGEHTHAIVDRAGQTVCRARLSWVSRTNPGS